MAIHFVILTILSHLNATELSTICTNTSSDCTISTQQSLVTNSSPFSSTNQISIQTQIDTFINYSTIKAQKIEVKNNNKDTDNHHITNFYNYGRIETTDNEGSLLTDTISTRGFHNIYNYGFISSNVFFAQSETQNTHIVNYGEMGGIGQNVNSNKPLSIDNRGVINVFQKNDTVTKAHFTNLQSLTIYNYAMKINVDSATFNSFDGKPKDSSHLVLYSVKSVSFANKNAKMILDFGENFEFGAGYLFSKLIVDESGGNKLNVDLSRLTTKSDIYYITQQGEHFIVNLAPQYSAIGNLYKANVRTMNNFTTMSNSMIFPRKHNSVILRERSDRRISKNISSLRADLQNLRGNPPIDSALDSAFSLKSYESFAYQSESQNPQTRRIQRQNKRNYSRNVKDSSLRADSQNLRGNPQNFTESKPYYFILTPFVNHNNFAKSGNYNLSGFDYGFLTAFSGKIAESNSLGAHFAFSYGSLNDKHDKDLSIHTMNFMLGVNYKLDLIYDMFLKARGDVFYFLNTLDFATIKNIKPNNLGFGVSVSYGKDFDFKQGGVLGIEGGLDYKALHANTITLYSMSETYQKQLYHLLYMDLGVSYTKYFANFGFNANLGIKGNITANKLAKSQIRLNNFNRSVDMILDNDKILGYANVALSYVLNHKNFDMEFSLAYYGNFGDRIISNGGGVEWRVRW